MEWKRREPRRVALIEPNAHLGGADVQFVTATYSPVSGRNTDNWEERYIVRRMKAAGVRLRPSKWLRAIQPGAVLLSDIHTNAESHEPTDAVVLSTGIFRNRTAPRRGKSAKFSTRRISGWCGSDFGVLMHCTGFSDNDR